MVQQHVPQLEREIALVSQRPVTEDKERFERVTADEAHDAEKDWRTGLQQPFLDEHWTRGEHYEKNLEVMIETGCEHCKQFLQEPSLGV